MTRGSALFFILVGICRAKDKLGMHACGSTFIIDPCMPTSPPCLLHTPIGTYPPPCTRFALTLTSALPPNLFLTPNLSSLFSPFSPATLPSSLFLDPPPFTPVTLLGRTQRRQSHANVVKSFFRIQLKVTQLWITVYLLISES